MTKWALGLGMFINNDQRIFIRLVEQANMHFGMLCVSVTIAVDLVTIALWHAVCKCYNRCWSHRRIGSVDGKCMTENVWRKRVTNKVTDKRVKRNERQINEFRNRFWEETKKQESRQSSMGAVNFLQRITGSFVVIRRIWRRVGLVIGNGNDDVKGCEWRW